MNPDDIHQWIRDNWATQQAVIPQPCPEGTTKNDWKNRHRISAKLRPENYRRFVSFCRDEGYSANTGLNQILSFFFHHLNHD